MEFAVYSTPVKLIFARFVCTIMPGDRNSVQFSRITLLLACITFTGVAGAKGAANKDTERTMRLLYANCLSCHNAEKHKGGLELSSRTAALKGREDGPVIVPGQPDKSALLKALALDADPHMPPKKQLTNVQREAVREWIAEIGRAHV